MKFLKPLDTSQSDRLIPKHFKLKNRTKYPVNEIEELILFAASTIEDSPDVTNVEFTIRYHDKRREEHAFSGWYRYWFRDRHNKRGTTYREAITISLGTTDQHWPAKNEKLYESGPSTYYLKDWKEAVVAMAAHEIEHCWQWRNYRQMSEVDCEWAELNAVYLWRKKTEESEAKK